MTKNVWNEEKMDDNGRSKLIRDSAVLPQTGVDDIESDFYTGLLHSHKLVRPGEVDDFHKTYRFGVFNPFNKLTKTREFLFFTKPDLNILARDDVTGTLTTTNGRLNEALEYIPFWRDIAKNRKVWFI